MDKQSKLEYQHKVEKYLSETHVYDLFEDLLKNIIIKQPDDPIAYMIDKLAEPPSIHPITQSRRFSLLVPPCRRSENWHFKSQTTSN